MHIHLSGVAFHVLCVGLGFHVVIGVGRLVVRFHHAKVIPSFLLDVVVRLYLVIVNSDCSHNYCMLHIAKTGSVRCCPCTPAVGHSRPLSAGNDLSGTKSIEFLKAIFRCFRQSTVHNRSLSSSPKTLLASSLTF